MKVIIQDNFGREHISDYLYMSNFTPNQAHALAKRKNAELGDKSPHLFKAVPDDYVLFEYEP